MKTAYDLCFQEHYTLYVDLFPYDGDGHPATQAYYFEDLETAMKFYLWIFLECDFVKSCEITKHVRHVPRKFYLAHFRRSKT